MRCDAAKLLMSLWWVGDGAIRCESCTRRPRWEEVGRGLGQEHKGGRSLRRGHLEAPRVNVSDLRVASMETR